MNNYEKIKNMTLNEMAEFMNKPEFKCLPACNCKNCYESICINAIKQYLQQENEG